MLLLLIKGQKYLNCFLKLLCFLFMRKIKRKSNKIKKEVKTAHGTPSLAPLDVGLGEGSLSGSLQSNSSHPL